MLQKLEEKMKELERQHQEQLEKAQKEAMSKMGELEEVLQSKVAREQELEQEREAIRIESEETKVKFQNNWLFVKINLCKCYCGMCIPLCDDNGVTQQI